MKNKIRNIITVAFLLLLAANTNAQHTAFGLRTGMYSDAEAVFVGAEFLFPVAEDFYANPNLEYIFVKNGTYLTINMDAHYDYFTSQAVYLWAGAGLGILYRNPEGRPPSDTNAGLNLLLGLGFRTNSNVLPYIQVKGIIAENNELSVGLGLRF